MRLCSSCAAEKRELATESKRHYKGFNLREFFSFKLSAKRRGLDWDITESVLDNLWDKQKGFCALTKEPLVKTPRSWSLDRIDNSKGYVPDNVQLVTKEINMFRGSLDIETFKKLCKKVVYSNESLV
jgi:hypothetical protein